MRKLATLSAYLIVLGACAGAPEGTIALREPESPFIAFNIWVKVGSQNDPAGKEGLAALAANLLSDGSTTEDSYDAILEKLYPMATGYGYSVDKEMTVFRGRVHEDNLDDYYELFRNHLLFPAFDGGDFTGDVPPPPGLGPARPPVHSRRWNPPTRRARARSLVAGASRGGRCRSVHQVRPGLRCGDAHVPRIIALPARPRSRGRLAGDRGTIGPTRR